MNIKDTYNFKKNNKNYKNKLTNLKLQKLNNLELKDNLILNQKIYLKIKTI